MSFRSGDRDVPSNFTDEELVCYETWYSIIQRINNKYPELSDLNSNHDIPKFGIATARFLNTSGVPKDVLHDIWQIVDVNNEGVLNISEFGNACRLVSFYQHENLLPKPQIVTRIPNKLAYFNISKFWDDAEKGVHVGQISKCNTNEILDSYFSDISHISACLKRFKVLSERSGGFLDSKAIFDVYIDSKLSRAELKKIWSFSDIDEDGRISAAEFIIFNTLVKVSVERNIKIDSEISKRSMVLIINQIIGMDRVATDVCHEDNFVLGEGNLFQLPSNNGLKELSCEIERLNSEIHDFKLAKDVLKCYKDNDDLQIIKLNERKLKLVAEHKDILQTLNSKYSEIIKNRDLINYLYQDIKFLKETNNVLSRLDLQKFINKKSDKLHSNTNVRITPMSDKNMGNVILEKSQSRKYSNWVEFPSRDRSTERNF
ncbi:EFh-containing protein [Cryptosporidium canis]|uniref:EFh-containing protein n=1 Tax=Cryptosporidium canis TaxID=195482 RepID=A0ABQ8PAP5_9CRYT|nr:EFh-containing protein [Cryptosporidium canis]